MTKEYEEPEVVAEAVPVMGTVRNFGEPLIFKDVEPLVGFSAESAKGGAVKVWTRHALTSEQPLFHHIVESIVGVINHMAQKAGMAVNLHRADTILFVIKPDNTAELWLDTAAVSIQCAVKRDVELGTVIFESDIADITGLCFPCVKFGEKDKVLCVFREAWRFGLAFDMNPGGQLDVNSFFTTLGTLHRELRYRHLYLAMANETLLARLISAGWFPFVEIINSEFKELLQHSEAEFNLPDVETAILAKFDDSRIQRLLARWLAKPHFAAKSELLAEATDGFISGKPITVLKILLTEIEGILNDAYRAEHNGQGAKLKELLAFAEASASQRAGRSDTLLFPAAFGRYLSHYTFANFDPVAQTGAAGSRHAVGHGAAAQETYTMLRALQAILTLDQLAFYT